MIADLTIPDEALWFLAGFVAFPLLFLFIGLLLVLWEGEV